MTRTVHLRTGRTSRVRVGPSAVELASRPRRGAHLGLGGGVMHLYRPLRTGREVVYGEAEQGAAGFIEAVLAVGVSSGLDVVFVPRLALGALPTERSFTGTMTIATPDGPRTAALADAYASTERAPVLVPSGLVAIRAALLPAWSLSLGIRAGAEVPVGTERESRFSGERIYGSPLVLDGS